MNKLNFRVGLGYDLHRLEVNRDLKIGGVHQHILEYSLVEPAIPIPNYQHRQNLKLLIHSLQLKLIKEPIL